MYCYRCGQRLADGAKHCPGCGAAIFYDENGPLDGSFSRDPGRPEDASYSYGGYQDNTQYQYGDAGQSSGNAYQYGNYQTSQYYAPPEKTSKDTCALISMILGIVSLVLCCSPVIGVILGIAAIVLGIIGLKAPQRKGMAIAGLAVGIIGLLISGAMLAGTVYYASHPELLEEYLDKQLSSYEYNFR